MRFLCAGYLSLQAITAMSEIRLHDVVKRFSGGSSEDVAVWLRQLKLVAKLRKIADLSTIIPLFLDGAAFAVYEQLEEEAQGDAAKIESALVTAFGVDAFQAYEEFRTRVRRPGEPVDVFLSDLRRLASLAGVNSDALLRSAFVVGLPQVVSTQLRATAGIAKMALSEVVSLARALTSELAREEKASEDLCAAAAKVRLSTGRGRRDDHAAAELKAEALRCFTCGSPHLKRWCPQRRCFRCGEKGHHANACPVGGNGNGESHAPAHSP